MRIRWLLPVLSFAIATPAAAQRFDFGAYALWSSLSGSNSTYDTSSDVGYRFLAGVRIGHLLFVEPGIGYQSQAFKLSSASLSDGLRLNSVYVPLEFGANLSAKVVGLKLYAGPTVSFLTSVGSNDYDLSKDSFNSTQWGGVVGAEVKVLFIGVEGGYNFGFTNAFKDGSTCGASSCPDGKINSWFVGLGFFF